MSGDIVYSGHSITLLSCNTSKSPVHDEMMIKVTQEGMCAARCSLQTDSQWQEDAMRASPITLKVSDSEFGECDGDYGRRSPCWTDDQPSSQLLYSSARLRSPAELPRPLSGNVSHLAKNSAARLTAQRRGVRCKVRANRPTLKSTDGRNSQNRKIIDYFPIRRSSRKSKTELKCEEQKHIDNLITNGIEEGMKVQHIEGKGRGVFATRAFQKGQYVVEYHGDLLQITDAKKREAEYAQNPATGCYMYYFQYLCKTYCVDATKETGRMGRLINHSKNGNCQTKLHDIDGIPHLILVASRDIDEGEELLYDYGDRSKASIAAHPWLKY